MEIFFNALLIILIESPPPQHSPLWEFTEAYREAGRLESVLLAKVSSLGDTTPFFFFFFSRSATQKPPERC